MSKQKELPLEPGKPRDKEAGAPREMPVSGRHKPGPLQELIDDNFLQYASYVICERAIPALEDGLKPVQRRILHALHEMDDGRLIKVANVVGHTMQYHPHGDRSIADALVNLVNKGHLVEGQGNFGNPFTGDPAAAPRYIECRLTPLARAELFSDALTDYVPSYDGRSKEPVFLPTKLPLLLTLGAEGIAVGLSTRILPHNLRELLEAQIAILQKKKFRVFPDFLTGGSIDVSNYDDGNGTLPVRARMEPRADGLTIVELPWGATTESLIASIEEAIQKRKLPIKRITDYTSEKVEIALTLADGAEPAKVTKSLYAFTDCELKLAPRTVVLHHGRPEETDTGKVLRENTNLLVKTLKRELQHRKGQLLDALHAKTLAQIFIENRIYKKIEQCKTQPAVQKAVLDGLKPFRKMLKRDVTARDVERLLEIRIRRISQFDINKNRKEMDDILAELKTVEKCLADVTKHTIRYLRGLLRQIGDTCPRRTQVTRFEEIEVRALTANELTLCHDAATGYAGYEVKGAKLVTCSSLDKVVFVWKSGRYRVIPPPQKYFVGKDLVYAAVYRRDHTMTLVYHQEPFHYIKRFTFGGVIMDKEYLCTAEDSRIVFFSDEDPAELYVKYKPAKRQRIHQQLFHPRDLSVTSARAKGNLMTSKVIARISARKPRGWRNGKKSPKGVVMD